MASMVFNYAAKKLLNGEMQKYRGKKVGGDQDPYFVTIENPRKPGTFKKVKKQIPTYIPEREGIILAKMRKRAYSLDMQFSFLGMRLGWSSIIGIIPGFGDVADALLSILLVLRVRSQLKGELPASVQQKMITNIIMDFLFGLVPILGDVVDTLFKANTRNVRALEEWLDQKYKPRDDPRYKMRDSYVGGKARPPPPATVYEDFDDEQKDREDYIREQRAADRVQRPDETQTQTRNDQPSRGQGLGGWFSGSRRGDRQTDLERGQRRDAPPPQPPRPGYDSDQETGTMYNGHTR